MAHYNSTGRSNLINCTNTLTSNFSEYHAPLTAADMGRTPYNRNVLPFKNKDLNCKEADCSSLRMSLNLPPVFQQRNFQDWRTEIIQT